MGYETGQCGRVVSEASEPGSFWTYEAVEARLVETVRCWWRMPGGGRWPYASDGPWHLIRKEWEDWDARDPAPLRRLPLRRSEVREMEEATEWLTLVAEEKRRVLVLGLVQKAAGRKQVSWTAMLPKLGLSIGAGGLEYRYSQAIQFIANVLNASSGVPYAPRGVRVRYPAAVIEAVERLKVAEIRAERPSSPRMQRP